MKVDTKLTTTPTNKVLKIASTTVVSSAIASYHFRENPPSGSVGKRSTFNDTTKLAATLGPFVTPRSTVVRATKIWKSLAKQPAVSAYGASMSDGRWFLKRASYFLQARRAYKSTGAEVARRLHTVGPYPFLRLRMSAYGGKADSLSAPSECLLIARSGHSGARQHQPSWMR